MKVVRARARGPGENRNRLIYKTVSGDFEIFILHRFKAFFASLFGLSLTERSKIVITFLWV